jgi:hypothetical protein
MNALRLFLLCLMFLAGGVYAQQVTSTRVTQDDWQTQDADGNRLSGHQRFDTAVVACINNPACVYVQGGRYRIERATVTTGSATLRWTPPDHCTDGSPIANCPVTGYRIVYGRAADALSEAVDVPASATSHTLTELESGVWYFAVLALSERGASDLSETVSKSVS